MLRCEKVEGANELGMIDGYIPRNSWGMATS